VTKDEFEDASDTSRYGTRYSEDKMAARLSEASEVLVYSVVEGCNYCSLKCWKNGTEAWSVVRDQDSGKADRYNVFVSGSPPKKLDEIRLHYEKLQKEDDDCDYMMEIPTELALSVTGYRHDRFMAVCPEEFAELEKKDTTDYLVPRNL
jgi:hypothetical protein